MPRETVDVRLLGPVELVGPDGPVGLGGGRRRALFGLLALRAPRVVSQEALLDAIWGEDLPPSGTRNLHAHVAYLRRTLTDSDLGDLIVTCPPGYALALPAERIDTCRFESLVRRARTAESRHGAADLLREALGLCRGDLLAGCAVEDWGRAEVARFREARLTATEDALDAEIAVGRYGPAIAELEAMVATHPLRERFWELLMSALAGDGRQGDALGVYRRARATLVAELGVEPGPRLRRLEAAILAGDERRGGHGDERDDGRRDGHDGGHGVRHGGGHDYPPAVGRTSTSGRSPNEAPAPRTEEAADEPSLPRPLTSLIGRDHEITEVLALLGDRRLVTLTGVGGCGKTRLAIAVGEAYRGEVRFADLGPLREPDQVPVALCALLGVREDRGADPAEALVRHLRSRSMLLVLDNCEHLVDGCAALTEVLLRRCPALRVLATSQEALGVLGELAWPVPGLSLPPLTVPADEPLAAVRAYGAVRLLLDRAAVPAVRAVADGDAGALAEICVRLDGLPLALELAAARTGVLTFTEIAARVHDPALLRSGRARDGREALDDRGRDGRDRPGWRGRRHHHALHTTMSWSYDLLDVHARSALRRLAVFAGGFTLAAAEAVWPEAGSGAIDVLADLVAKSLVVVERERQGARYRLLETIRQFAADRLADHGDEADRARARHAAFYLTVAEDADSRLRGRHAADATRRFTIESENLRAAADWYAGAGDGAAGLRLAVAVARFHRLRGAYRQGRRWLDDALSRCTDGPAPLTNAALLAAAFLAYFDQAYRQADAHAERALAGFRRLADQPGEAKALRLLGSVARERGRYDQALDRYDKARATYSGTGDETGTADVLQMTGFTFWVAGDLRRAEWTLDEALRRYQAAGDGESIASTRIHLAMVAHYSGRTARARTLGEDAMATFEELDFKEGIAYALNVLGLVALRSGRHQEAVDTLGASLRVHHQVGDRWRRPSLVDALAQAHLAAGDPAHAARLIGLADTLRDPQGIPVPAQEHPDRERTIRSARRLLGEDEYYLAYTRGRHLHVEELFGQ